MTSDEANVVDFVRGDLVGLEFPAHPDALLEAGPQFLTRALHAFGSLASDNRITSIRLAPCEGGSSGRKAFLSVRYERQDTDLDADLFVKFSRDFTDRIRDRKSREMQSEVKLGKISRHPRFPIDVPKTYFADFDGATGTGMLITKRIAYGQNGIALQQPKSMDHELPNALEHYQAIFTALGRLIAAHKSGSLSPQVDEDFPFDPVQAMTGVTISYDAARLAAQLDRVEALVTRAPQLFPAEITSRQFFNDLRRGAERFLSHQDDIKRYLHLDPDYVGLCHWNANIDNAWFWRDASGRLQCGLIDWGGVSQLNLAYAIWGSLLAASDQIWDEHLDGLLKLLAAEIEAGGGPRLSTGKLRVHLDLYIGLIGVAAVIIAPDIILHRLPAAVDASGPHDPMFEDSEQARNFLRVLTNFLRLWDRHDLPRRLDALLEAIAAA